MSGEIGRNDGLKASHQANQGPYSYVTGMQKYLDHVMKVLYISMGWQLYQRALHAQKKMGLRKWKAGKIIPLCTRQLGFPERLQTVS